MIYYVTFLYGDLKCLKIKFSTATVPITITCLENIGIPSKITKFIVPIGATINMDGIALYESIGAIFIIQLHGLQYSLFKIITIMYVSL